MGAFKRILIVLSLLAAPMFILDQDSNTRYGGDDKNLSSTLVERVLKMEKKQDAFYVCLNFSSAGGIEVGGGDNKTGFKCKQLRLEIKGTLTDHLIVFAID